MLDANEQMMKVQSALLTLQLVPWYRRLRAAPGCSRYFCKVPGVRHFSGCQKDTF